VYSRHEFASRLGELSRDSAAGPAARRLGIAVWETWTWTKAIIDLNNDKLNPQVQRYECGRDLSYRGHLCGTVIRIAIKSKTQRPT